MAGGENGDLRVHRRSLQRQKKTRRPEASEPFRLRLGLTERRRCSLKVNGPWRRGKPKPTGSSGENFSDLFAVHQKFIGNSSAYVLMDEL